MARVLSVLRPNPYNSLLSHIHPLHERTEKILQPVPRSICEFIECLFEPDDIILIRPIETWTESYKGKSKKKSRVIYKEICYPKAASFVQDHTGWADLLHMSEQNAANLFFGVAPRFGPIHFDQAWQVRSIRALWADVDNCTEFEAIRRVKQAGLPRPTMLIRSGSGVHLYWRLDEAVSISDVGDPLPLFKKFLYNDVKDKREAIPYIINPETRKRILYPTISLSPKAQHVQAVIAAIADAIDGDHTHDLARILRIPATLNRKNQRMGQSPVPCELVFIEPDNRYAFQDFESFQLSISTKQTRNRSTLPRTKTPNARKRETFHEKCSLEELIEICRNKKVGDRSTAEFRLLCKGHEDGIDKESMWDKVKAIGKFAERGRDYFDCTFAAAKTRVQENRTKPSTENNNDLTDSGKNEINQLFNNIEGGGKRNPPPNNECGDNNNSSREPFRRVRLQANSDCYQSAQVVAKLLQHCPPLYQSWGTLYLRSLTNGHDSVAVITPRALSACVTAVAQFYNITERGETDVQPPASVIELICVQNTFPNVPIIERVTNGPTVTRKGQILVKPGYDSESRIFGAFAPLPEGILIPTNPSRLDAIEAARRLLNLVVDFPFASPASLTAWLAGLLTIILRPSLDRVPIFLIKANRQGTGKSKLVDLTTLITSGIEASPIDYSDDLDKLEKLVTSLIAEGKAIGNFDNIPNGSVFGNAVIDRLATASEWTGRRLGQTKTISAANNLTLFASGNNLTTRADTTRRVILCELHTDHAAPEDRADFEISDLVAYVRTHRYELLVDLLTIASAHVQAGCPGRANPMGSFETWTQQVLGAIRWLELPCPLEAMRELRIELNTTDAETVALLEALHANMKSTFTAAQVNKHLDELTGFAEADPAVEVLSELFAAPPRNRARAIGYVLRSQAGRWVVSGSRELRLVQAGKSGGVTRWKIEVRNAENFGPKLPTGAMGAIDSSSYTNPQTIREFLTRWYEQEKSAHSRLGLENIAPIAPIAPDAA